MTALLAMAIIGGVLGLGKGISKSEQRKAEYEEKLQEVDRQVEVLGSQNNQAEESHNLDTQQV